MNQSQNNSDAHVSAVYTYPVKGLNGTSLEQANLRPGATIKWDRSFAICLGNAEFDPENPVFMPKTKFLNLARHEKLATLEVQFDADSGILTIFRDGKQVARGKLLERIGRQMLEQFFAAYMADDMLGSPHILHGNRHSFSDVPEKCLSLINLASVRDLERVIGRPVDPLRFRGNVYIEGLEPWAELQWKGKDIWIGEEVQLGGLDPIGRCAATNINLETANRDLNIPQTLMQAFGHSDCGIYAEVISGGKLSAGDTIKVRL